MERISLGMLNGADLTYELHRASSENISGLIQISHGMAEHTGRYSEFIHHFNDHGFHVAISDHRGHGSRIVDHKVGYFNDPGAADGWSCVVDDLIAVSKSVASQCKEEGIKHILLGHSMGSWIALAAMQKNAIDQSSSIHLSAALISGSSQPDFFQTALQKTLIKAELLRLGHDGYSDVIHKAIFGGFNSSIALPTTPNDWLSRDAESVENYTNDPLCGFVVTNQLWDEVSKGVTQVFSANALSQLRTDLPMLVFSGSKDPVGGMGKGTTKLHQTLLSQGCNSELLLVNEARHETLNETDKLKTYDYIIKFIKKN